MKNYDASSGCEICSCENPCERHECPQDTKCSVDVSAAASGETVFVAVCRQHVKAGRCPYIEENSEECDRECDDDADCRGDYKCCVSGCSQICTAPEEERVRPPPTSPPRTEQDRQTELQEVSEEDLRPVAREGDVATLRCFATGFPPPSISWKKGGLEVNSFFSTAPINKINFIFVIFFAVISSRQIKDVIFSPRMETFRLFNFIEPMLELMFALLTMALETPFNVKSF